MDSPILTSAEMRNAEEAAFARGIKAETLMDEAGAGLAAAVTRFFPAPGHCIVFAGKGHNAGDAFVAAALLQRSGWEIEVRLAFPETDCSELTRQKLKVLRGETKRRDAARSVATRTIILDGLLGLGAKPPVREPILSACAEINRLRADSGAFVFAIDIPSGLDGDAGDADTNCVVADFTITIGFAKRGLVADQALDFVGRLDVVPLGDLRVEAKPARETIACAHSLRGLLPRRAFSSYKNQFGRIGIVAGSKGFSGAASMCSLGALRAGAGLVEVFVPEEIYPIVAAAAPAEAMVKQTASYRDLIDEPMDVWAIGPGLGKSRADEVIDFIKRAPQPTVVDADALNILAEDPGILNHCAGPRLLTPHAGEMKRIFPATEEDRAVTARKFCEKYPATLLLKGSRTIVAQQHHALSFNSTGNPGMATGGMGDVLMGICAALIAQRRSLYDAARIGAWVCGRAAEIAIFQRGASEQSLLPRDVLSHLGRAFADLQLRG